MAKWAELSDEQRRAVIAAGVMDIRRVKIMHPPKLYEGEPDASLVVWLDDQGVPHTVDAYTTDMNAAMTVVEQMRARGFRGFELSATISEGRYRVRFETFDVVMTGRDNVVIEINPAEAICHAAALAVGAVED
jgi:hypothetical protein